ncbi:hypothetical protein [Ohtaekwangia koreensis]|nr:hypothetical protein [Ohtaekwangia koreensis]
MKKIWDTQNSRLLYTIDETALGNLIARKKKKTNHITNITELLLIVVNLASGIFIAILSSSMQKGNILMYLTSLWMLGTAVYIVISRLRRLRQSHQFDRSMQGDLQYTISVATYQVRLSLLMRWNMLPVAILTALGVLNGGKSIGIIIGTLLLFILVYYASRWEHNIYKYRKLELESLQRKLQSEDVENLT